MPCTEFLKIISDFWTLKIIIKLNTKEKRFCELERSIPKINSVTLTSRLKKMEKLHIIKRVEGKNRQPVIYTLTKKGLPLISIAQNIEDYGKKFY